jgi:phospholipid transport system substrate-binding protein
MKPLRMLIVFVFPLSKMTPGRAIWTLFLVLALSSIPDAWAGAPTDELGAGVDRVFEILRDPELKGGTNASRRWVAIARVSEEIFDFGETARRSLGQHWDRRTPAEREEFVRLFTDLIQRSYVTKIDRYSGEKMVFRGETVDGDEAVVRTALTLDDGGRLPLDYKMHHTRDRWQVYDINVEGVSLVANYRAQFNKVIRSESYEALVTRLKANHAEFAASPAGVTSSP